MSVEAEWFDGLGALPAPGGARFRVWAPGASRVELVLEAGASVSLAALGDGRFETTAPGIGPGARYRYRLDGRGPFPDPASRRQPEGVHGPSEIVDPGAFAWSNAEWVGRPLEGLVLYELHVGTFTPEGTYAAAAARLPDLAGLGVNAIQLMPVAEFPGVRNWGYDGAALFAPSHAYGTPDDLRRLVDEAHRLGLGVHLDLVYNHLGPDGAYVVAFAPAFLTRRHRSAWGAGVDLDGPQSAGVRAFLIANAAHWVREYHLDGIRLDATPAMIDASPRHLVADLVERVKQIAAPRPCVVIAEDIRNQAAVLAPPERGGWGADGLWSFDFHRLTHRILTGEHAGYFVDYPDRFEDLAATVRRGWLYTGQESAFWKGPRGTDPAGVPSQRMVFYLQTHDEVGNRPDGRRLHHLVDLAPWRAATALLLLAPQTPLLFMGQEWAASTPYLFFTDHREPIGARAAEGRRRFFIEYFGATPERAAGVPDPQDPATMKRSVLDWSERDTEPHASVLRLHRALLRLRHDDPALAAGAGCRVEPFEDPVRGVALRRDGANGAALLAAIGLRDRGEAIVPPEISSLPGGRWSVLLTTEDPPFATDPMPPAVETDEGVRVVFERPGAVVLLAEPG